jgi:hypothetical protein
MSVTAYHALGEKGLVPKNTELLYGLVYTKRPKSPFACFLIRRLLERLDSATRATHLVSSEQPITCLDSEPEPNISVVRGTNEAFWDEHPHTAELVIEVSHYIF